MIGSMIVRVRSIYEGEMEEILAIIKMINEFHRNHIFSLGTPITVLDNFGRPIGELVDGGSGIWSFRADHGVVEEWED